MRRPRGVRETGEGTTTALASERRVPSSRGPAQRCKEVRELPWAEIGTCAGRAPEKTPGPKSGTSARSTHGVRLAGEVGLQGALRRVAAGDTHP